MDRDGFGRQLDELAVTIGALLDRLLRLTNRAQIVEDALNDQPAAQLDDGGGDLHRDTVAVPIDDLGIETAGGLGGGVVAKHTHEPGPFFRGMEVALVHEPDLFERAPDQLLCPLVGVQQRPGRGVGKEDGDVGLLEQRAVSSCRGLHVLNSSDAGAGVDNEAVENHPPIGKGLGDLSQRHPDG